MKSRKLLNPAYVYQRRHQILPTIERTITAAREKLGVSVFNFAKQLAQFGIIITSNNRRLATLKDCHKGKHCFVIGNGPSLSIQDLNWLKGEITFASNKIYLAFGQTDWRPTYYTVIDGLVAMNCCHVINKLMLTKLLPYDLRVVLGGDDSIVYFVNSGGNLNGFSPNPFLEDLHGGYTVIFTQLQLAYYMGFEEVYLIGMDHTWNLPSGEQRARGKEIIIISEGEQNHFHPNYRLPGEEWSLPKPKLQEEAFRIARTYYEDHGRCIYNATRGGRLEIFKRVYFDQIVSASTLDLE